MTYSNGRWSQNQQVKNDSAIRLSGNGTAGLMENDYLELSSAQNSLRKAHSLFAASKDVGPMQCDEAITSMVTLSKSVGRFCKDIGRSQDALGAKSSEQYKVLASLCYIDEQAKHLAVMIGNFRSNCLDRSISNANRQQEIQRQIARLLQASSLVSELA